VGIQLFPDDIACFVPDENSSNIQPVTAGKSGLSGICVEKFQGSSSFLASEDRALPGRI
jgi:hypothetical protein